MKTTDNHLPVFRLGLVLNPVAGLGGPAGLKGSDHQDTSLIAAERGVKSKVNKRVAEMLAALQAAVLQTAVPQIRDETVHIVTASGSMGAQVCETFGHFFSLEVVYDTPENTCANDTYLAARLICQHKVDLLVFAGGDGTARDIYNAVGSTQTVLGLPAGVKMHSGVFAVTPKAVVSIIDSMIRRRLVAARMAEVRDINEAEFKLGRVCTQYYGEMLIPDDQLLVQSVKCSGLLDDELMLEEISAYMVEELKDNTLYLLGSGGTLKALKDVMGIESPTLLGVDVWFQGKGRGELTLRDAHEAQIFELIQSYDNVRIILSIIGGQGIVLGRGNQQISPRIIEQVGLENIQLVSTQNKILALAGRPLQVDSGSDKLDRQFAGFHKIICGYEDALLYEVCYSE